MEVMLAHFLNKNALFHIGIPLLLVVVRAGDGAEIQAAVAVGGRGRRLIFLAEGVLVVVHPDFEDPFLDADFAAEFANYILVPLLHFPPHPLCKFQHLLLLILGEPRAEALPAAAGD